VFNRLGKTHDHGASTPSHIRIRLKMDRCETTLLDGCPKLKQTASRFEANFHVRGTDFS